MKRRILIADGEGQRLSELSAELGTVAPEWDVTVSPSGTAALAQLAAAPANAVVTDLQLADMSGEQLLGQVLHQFPKTHRVVLAELGDLQSLLRCVGGAHQFVIQPCTAVRLHTVLLRAFDLDVWLPNQTVRKLVGRVPRLPSIPSSYHAVVREAQATTATAEIVGAAIARDPAMTAKMLQLANSAAYGDPTDDYDPVEAVREIGVANARSCLLLSHTWSNFGPLEQSGFAVQPLWTHANQVAQIAAWLAQIEGASAQHIGMAKTAGLLHDLGKLALAANLPELFLRAVALAKQLGGDFSAAEQEVFGATHGEVGGCLLGLWGLPVPVVEAVALHHNPACLSSKSFSPLTAVHVANALLHAESPEHFRALVDRDYLAVLGLEGKIPTWWKQSRPEIERLHHG